MRRDGRVARSARSREAVADAVLSLLMAGTARPTAAAIADRAGVSLRSVHNHFRDREALFGAAIELQSRRVAPLIEPIPVDRPIGERIDALTKSRARLCEAIAPVRRAALAAALVSPRVRQALDAVRKRKREQVARLFATELAALARGERSDLLAAASAAASFSAWEELRNHQGLSVARARRVMAMALARLFEVSR